MKINKLHGLGNHLMLDGYSLADLDNEIFIKDLLLDLVGKLKMKAISNPLVVNYKAESDEESGITGVVLLAESNITIHTYPKKKWFSLDIYSCNEFSLEVIDYLIDKLKIQDYEKKLLRRGLK